MSEIIDLKNIVVNKQDFNKVVDTSFTTFVDEVSTVTELTVDEFFAEYERLFTDIPVNGPVNSHEYIFNRSGKFFEYEKDTQDIQPLLDEIALLRRQLLGNVALQSLENTRLDDQIDIIQQALVQNVSPTEIPSTGNGTGGSSGGGGGGIGGVDDIIDLETGGPTSDGNTGRSGL